MEIKLNKIDQEKLDILLSVKEANINIADIILTAFSYVDLLTFDTSKEELKSLDSSSIINKIFDSFQIEKDDENLKIFENCSVFEKLDPKNYENEYTKSFSNLKAKYKNYSLKKLTYDPYQLFASDEIEIIDDNYLERSKIGYFEKPFSYLALCEGNNVWMSLNPNEINTMKPFIEKATGDVLVLGLGMGYVAFMMALKPSVKSITIVEKDQNIIDLFKNALFPYFINKEKIKIVKDDAIKYVENHNNFDFIFADLWHTPEDGIIPYLKLRKIEKSSKIKINYWLDKSLEAMRRRYLLSLIQEAQLGYDEKQYSSTKTVEEKILAQLYKEHLHTKITDFQHIKQCLEK